jgi:putative transposase
MAMSKRRIHSEGTYAHYVTFSCYKRRQLLSPDKCKRIVLGELTSQLRKHAAICVGFVVMLDHLHAVIWFSEEHKISAFMEDWKTFTSSAISVIYEREFPKYSAAAGQGSTVWQSKYYDFNIHSDEKLREKLDYMHNNPVRAGLVREMCEWPWSSARFWHLGKQVGVPLSWPG